MSTPPSRTRGTESTLTPPQTPEGIRVHGEDEFDKEFVTHDGYSVFSHLRTLFHGVTDIQREITPEECERMSRDPKIHKAKRIIINGTLTDDLQFAPGATEDEAGSDAEFRKFEDIQQFCERMIGGLERPIWMVLEEMLGGTLEQGHKIAETVWHTVVDKPTRRARKAATRTSNPRPQSFLGRLFGTPKAAEDDEEETPAPNRFARRATARLMPKSIKVKPRGSALFVVDDFMNVMGIVPAHAGQQSWTTNEVVSRDKFLVLTLNGQDNDPRGMSTWRPAYNYFNLVGHIPKNYLKLMLQEGMPIPVLTLPPKTEGWLFARDPNTKEILYEDGKPKMVETIVAAEMTLEKMFLGKGVGIPAEAKLEPYNKTRATGGVFPEALKVIYNIIEECILLQPLAQSAGDVQSKSAAAIHADVLGDAFFWYKRACAMMLLYDLCAVGVRVNFGEWALAYMPKLSLGDFEKRDWLRELEVLAKAFWYGFIDETQRAEIMAWMGLPKPGPAPTEPKAGKAQADANGDPAPPSDQRPDKQGRGRKQPDEGQDLDTMMREKFEEVSARVTAHESSFSSVGHNARRRKTFVEYLPGRAFAPRRRRGQ